MSILLFQPVRAQLALNYAALLTERAAAGHDSWPPAEQAWLAAGQLAGARVATNQGLGRTYWLWYRADPASMLAAGQALFDRQDLPANPSDLFAAIGDALRGHGVLAPAETFYRAAVKRADFSSPTLVAQTQFNLSLVSSTSPANLVTNGDFSAGLAGWQTSLGNASGADCQPGCNMSQVVPLLGAGVYRLSAEGRTDAGAAELLVHGALAEDAPWSLDTRWPLATEWQSFSTTTWLPSFGLSDMTLSLRLNGASRTELRGIRFEKLDLPGNLLLNASFEVSDSGVVPDGPFPAWTFSQFWNAAQAVGARRAVPGENSDGAIELALTGATSAGQRLGVQQPCGMLRAGARLELQADFNLPNKLAASVARVQTTVYDPYDNRHYVSLNLADTRATTGWQHLTASGMVPAAPGEYGCITTIDLVASQPAASVADAARFDNILLQLVP